MLYFAMFLFDSGRIKLSKIKYCRLLSSTFHRKMVCKNFFVKNIFFVLFFSFSFSLASLRIVLSVIEASLNMAQLPAALNPKEDDIAKMLACNVHLGTRNLDASMERYIYKRRADGKELSL
jgi:hypothetical protein